MDPMGDPYVTLEKSRRAQRQATIWLNADFILQSSKQTTYINQDSIHQFIEILFSQDTATARVITIGLEEMQLICSPSYSSGVSGIVVGRMIDIEVSCTVAALLNCGYSVVRPVGCLKVVWKHIAHMVWCVGWCQVACMHAGLSGWAYSVDCCSCVMLRSDLISDSSPQVQIEY
jgi:hypothetical protein